MYIAVGIGGGIAHFSELRRLEPDSFAIELTELVALLSGLFMLRGQNLARWTALAWIAFHVGLSVFHSVPELAAHAVFFVLIAWILLRPPAAAWFRTAS